MSKIIFLISIFFSFFLNAQQVYEGVGFQIDIEENWKIKLEINKTGEYIVTYPTIPCKAIWDNIYQNGNKTYFREKITNGTELCNDNGIILLVKESSTTYLFFIYLDENENKPYAYGKLIKNK